MDTKDLNQLAINADKDKTYHYYDLMIAATLENICEMSDDAIRLYRFNRSNKDHLCVLHIALMARDLFHFHIKVDASWWDVFLLNWKLRKRFNKIERFKPKLSIEAPRGVNVLMLIDKFHTISPKAFGGVEFKDIYEAYYEGEK